MTFTSLASSSRGNAYVVSDGETTLLLECGLSFKELQKRLGYGVADITACLVSHEHQDHAKAAAQMLKAGVPVYMSEGTAAAHKDAMDAAHLIRAGEVLRFGHLTVVPFRTYHNVEEPLGFLIEDGRTKERLLWAVDTANLGVTADRRNRHSHFEVNDVIKWLHKQDLRGVLTIWLLHLSAGNSRAEAWQRRFEREFPGISIRICEE